MLRCCGTDGPLKDHYFFLRKNNTTSGSRASPCLTRTHQPTECRYTEVRRVDNTPGHWFLHVARLSSRAHSESELLVRAGRGGHVHSVDVGIFEQIVQLGVKLRDAVSLGEVLRGTFRPALCRAAKGKEGGGWAGTHPTILQSRTPCSLGLVPAQSPGRRASGFSLDQASIAPSAKRRIASGKALER